MCVRLCERISEREREGGNSEGEREGKGREGKTASNGRWRSTPMQPEAADENRRNINHRPTRLKVVKKGEKEDGFFFFFFFSLLTNRTLPPRVGAHLETAAAAGIVDPDVDLAHLALSCVSQALHAGRAGDVTVHACHPGAPSYLQARITGNFQRLKKKKKTCKEICI